MADDGTEKVMTVSLSFWSVIIIILRLIFEKPLCGTQRRKLKTVGQFRASSLPNGVWVGIESPQEPIHGRLIRIKN